MFGAQVKMAPLAALYLNDSAAKRHFKNSLGQANHLLVTVLVGLSAVEQGLVIAAPPELHAAWNPQSTNASAQRARIMVLEMALIRAADALDGYLRLVRRKPSLIQNAETQSQIDGAGQSVRRKLRVVSRTYTLDRRLVALVEVMLAWRNKLVHSDDDVALEDEIWEVLKSNEQWIKDTFQGFAVDRLMSDYSADLTPTFKETASFIRATHWIIIELDKVLLQNLDTRPYLYQFVSTTLSKNGLSGKSSKFDHIQSVWGRDSSEKIARVIAFLKGNGLADIRKSEYSAVFETPLIEELANYTPKTLAQALSTQA